MELEDYKQILQLDTLPFSRISKSLFASVMRGIHSCIDKNTINQLGIPQSAPRFYEDFDEAIIAIEATFSLPKKFIETKEINTLLNEAKVKGSAINQMFKGMTKLTNESLQESIKRLYGITQSFVKARQKSSQEFLEVALVICDKLLQEENKRDILKISSATLEIIKELDEICKKLDNLFMSRLQKRNLRQIAQKKETCIVLYNYLCAKVLTQANLENPNKVVVNFVENHNREVSQIRKTHNLKMGHKK